MASPAQLAGMIRTNMDELTRSVFRRQLVYFQVGGIVFVVLLLLDLLRGC